MQMVKKKKTSSFIRFFFWLSCLVLLIQVADLFIDFTAEEVFKTLVKIGCVWVFWSQLKKD